GRATLWGAEEPGTGAERSAKSAVDRSRRRYAHGRAPPALLDADRRRRRAGRSPHQARAPPRREPRPLQGQVGKLRSGRPPLSASACGSFVWLGLRLRFGVALTTLGFGTTP